MKKTLAASTLVIVLGTQACIEFKDDDAKKNSSATPATTQVTDSSDIAVPSYEAYAMDTAGVGARYSSIPADDSLYSGISEASAETKATRFPIRIPKRGAAALQLQVLLDRARFSPRILDGVWGDNAAKALAFFESPGSTDSSLAADSS